MIARMRAWGLPILIAVIACAAGAIHAAMAQTLMYPAYGAPLAIGGCTIGTDSLCTAGTVTIGNTLTVNGAVTISSAQKLQWGGGCRVNGGTDGVFNPQNNAQTTVCGYKATATNDNALAGNVGEYVSAGVLAGSAVALVSGTAKDVTNTGVLGAGDWEICGQVTIANGASATGTLVAGWTSTVSATVPTIPNGGAYYQQTVSVAPSTSFAFPVGCQRVSSAASFTAYLSTLETYSGSGGTAYGFIWARRSR